MKTKARTAQSIDFRDSTLAQHDLETISRGLSAAVVRQIRSLLSASPDPDRVVHAMASLRNQKPEDFTRIVNSRSGLQKLTAVFAWSRFLTEEALQHPEWLQDLEDPERVLSKEEYVEQLDTALAGVQPDTPDTLTLAQFRRRQILRILICDVLGLSTLSEITEQLSNLADAILEVSFRRIRNALVQRHGVPRFVDIDGETRECGFAVIALGKLGGAS